MLLDGAADDSDSFVNREQRALARVRQHANDETVLILQIESAEAYEKVDETLKLKDFEVLLFGPADMSASLGVPGKTHHPKVEKVMIDLAKKEWWVKGR